MKKVFYIVCCAAMTLVILTAFTVSSYQDRVSGEWDIAVVSDIHLMAPELVESDGKAFQECLSSDRKLLGESVELLDSVSERLMNTRPAFVFIPGDLTKDGEAVSHRLLVNRYLSLWRKAGIKVFVVPGNHDVNNPRAVRFDGDNSYRVKSVTAKEFATTYRDYGYGNAIARDKHSLSYVAQLQPGLRLLALDACRYEENDFQRNTCITSGRLKPQTLGFIRQQVDKARRDGAKIVAMMHHGVIPHFSLEKEILPEYLVKDNDRVARMLADLGVKVVFTGHLHSHDISSDGFLTDIETGSTVSYPNPYRLIRLAGDSMHVTTRHITSLASLAHRGVSLNEKAKAFATIAIMKMLKSHFPDKSNEDAVNTIGELFTEAYVSHLRGDETPTDDWKERVDGIVMELRKAFPLEADLVEAIAKSFATDTPPADNEVTLAY